MSSSMDAGVPETPALPKDVISNVLRFLDVSLRERCQLQLVCRSFRDTLNDPQSSAVWGTCSLERDFPDNITFNELKRWLLKPGRVFRHVDNLRTPASRSSTDRIRRLQKTITVLLPELAGMLERTGATMHLELTQGIISGLLCRTIQSYQQDISSFWASVSGCLTRLTIEVPAKHLSACCVSTAPLVALQHLELSCIAPVAQEDMAALPGQIIAISLPQLTCLSLPCVACQVALHLDSPKLQILRIDFKRDIVSFGVTAPSLKQLALRNIRLQPAVLHNDAANGSSVSAYMSSLTSLELRNHGILGWVHDTEALVHLTNLTRLVATQMPSGLEPSLPASLRRLIIERLIMNGRILEGQDLTEAPEPLASVWHLESLQVIVPNCDGKLYNSELDVPWGMGSLRQWHRGCNQDGLYPSEKGWVQEVLKEAKETEAVVNLSTSLLMITYRKHGLPGQRGFRV